MPNWVYSKVSISGPKETLDTIESTLIETADSDERSPITFQNLLPRPVDQEDNWYEWNISNWQTKWDACRAEAERTDDNTLTYTFETAWSPPGPIFEVLSQRWPDTTVAIDYEEETGWGGRIRTEHGKFIEHVNWDAPESHAEAINVRGECVCNDDYVAYPDCWVERAKAENLPQQAIDTIAALTDQWAGTYAELAAASQKL